VRHSRPDCWPKNALSDCKKLSSPRDKTAARYGMSESNVKISIHRGLKALASFIGRDSDE
jgi:hypothetical protein